MNCLPVRSLMMAALISLLGFATSVDAQAGGRVRGRVTEGGTGAPVSDAQVMVVGTDRGGVTGGDGRYVIDNLPAGAREIRVRKIGYASASATVNVATLTEATANFTLVQAPSQLSEVVVTGTPLGQEKRSLGNSVTTLDVADLTEKTTIQNITEVLQSKTPGVQILPGSGVAGTSAEIRIRGASSLSGYAPVVYIDGIRYNIESLGNFAPTGSGLAGQAQSAQSTSGLNLLSPEVIESIEVLKGPAAATLYGADAAGGVIQIITKKGSRGQQKLRWNAKVDRGQTEWALDTPINFTTCDAAKQTTVQAAIWPGCQGVPVNTVLVDEPMKRDPDALRTGDLTRLSLSMRGGGDIFSFFLNGLQDDEKGVYLNNYNLRRGLQANFNVSPSQKFDFNVTMGYTNTRFRLPYQDESANALLLSAARGKPGRASVNGEGWATVNPQQSNRYNNFTNAERMTIGSTFQFRPLSWFRNRFTAGLDYTSTLAQLQAEAGAVETVEGFTAQRTPRTHIYTIDYAGSIVRPIGSVLESTTSFGSQVIARKDENLGATGTGLGAPDVTLIGSAAITSGFNSFSENNSVGYYAQQQLAWNNRLYVTAALRADDHSSFGTNFDWIVYPKASLSWVISEEPWMANLANRLRTDELRFRTAWGRAGRAPSAYSATQTYGVDKVTLGNITGSALRTGAFGNPNLEPETGEEIEIGFDAGFMQRRAGIEFTYYNKNVSGMLLSVPLAGSLGFPGSLLVNTGEVQNSGMEMGLTFSPLRGNRLAWESRLNLSTNKNELKSIGDLASPPGIPGQAYGALQRHRVPDPDGRTYPLGGYWGALPLRDADGNYIMKGVAVQLDTVTYIGPSAPTREIGFSNTFTILRNFRIYALLDYKGGHYLYNYKEFNRCAFQDNCARLNDPIFRASTAPADVALQAVYRQASATYVEKADFLKLRDLSFGWTVPTRLVSGIGASSATLTLAGHNLGLWTDYSGLDPEVNSYGGRNFARADVYASPMFRRWSMTLNLGY